MFVLLTYLHALEISRTFQCKATAKDFNQLTNCCHTGTAIAIKRPVPDRIKPSFVIFDNPSL